MLVAKKDERQYGKQKGVCCIMACWARTRMKDDMKSKGGVLIHGMLGANKDERQYEKQNGGWWNHGMLIGNKDERQYGKQKGVC